MGYARKGEVLSIYRLLKGFTLGRERRMIRFMWGSFETFLLVD